MPEFYCCRKRPKHIWVTKGSMLQASWREQPTWMPSRYR
jgi:hypothetical protein